MNDIWSRYSAVHSTVIVLHGYCKLQSKKYSLTWPTLNTEYASMPSLSDCILYKMWALVAKCSQCTQIQTQVRPQGIGTE